MIRRLASAARQASLLQIALVASTFANIATMLMVAYFLLAKPDVPINGTVYVANEVRIENGRRSDPLQVEIVSGKVKVDGLISTEIQGSVRVREPLAVSIIP